MPIPKAHSGGTAVRVVGSRQIPEHLNISEADLDGFTSEEVAEAYVDAVLHRQPPAGAKPLTDQQRSDLERIVSQSSPSEFAVEHILTSQVPEELIIRMMNGHHALVAVIYDRSSWLSPLEQAFSNVVRRACLRLGGSPNAAVDIQEGATRTGDASIDLGWDVSYFLERLNRGHVLVSQHRDKELDSDARMIADAVIDLRVTVDAMLVGIRSRHPRFETWPAEVDSAIVLPKALDQASVRGQTVEGATKLLIGLSRSIAERRAKEDAILFDNKGKVKTAETKATPKKDTVEILHPTSPTIDDIFVPEAFRLWCRDLLRDVREHREGRLSWTDVDGGCLLYGPPGTGKTMVVSALAASLGVSFIASSFSQWQGPKGGHLGDVVQSMQKVFATAAEAAPCLLFIDEIDSVPARNGGGQHEDYWRPITNAMLELLDGTARREGVIVIAATNDPAKLDPAMVRSGRLDRRFEIGLPDEAGLLRVMLHHLPGADADALAPAATALAGSTSPADVARIAREARRAARRQDRSVTAEDLLAIAVPADPRPSVLTRRIAVHEAGHAVGFLAYGLLPESLSLVPSGNGMGGHVYVRYDDATPLDARIVPMLSARAAEDVVLGSPSLGAIGDLAEVTREASVYLAGGMGASLSISSGAPAEDVEALVRRFYGEAMLLVLRYRAAVEVLAALALERRVLGKRVLADFATEFGIGGGR